MAAEAEHGLRDIAVNTSCLPDSMPPGWIESKRLIAWREREKEATGPAGRGAGRQGPISAEGGPQTGRAFRLVMERAISSAGFAVIEEILRLM